MSAPTTSRLLTRASRTASRSLLRTTSRQQQRNALARHNVPAFTTRSAPNSSARCFSTTQRAATGIMPDSENPSTPKRDDTTSYIAAEVTDDEFHALADEFLEKLNDRAEAIQEGREDVEVEFSSGVLTLTHPPNGTYVLNKQPPNKQIWLSSPITGPKRFDWTLQGESMHQKEGGAIGDWIYLRDGTSLSELLRKELGISVDVDGTEEAMKERSVDPTE